MPKRSRNKSGRITAKKAKTSNHLPPPSSSPEPTVPSTSPELYPDELPSSDEADNQPGPSTREEPSRAVSAELEEWLPLAQEFLEEFDRLETVGGDPLQCVKCQSPALFRCTDCSGLGLLCEACLLAAHARHPFHHVEKWNGQDFKKESLGDLGLVLQLGHDSTRESCLYRSDNYPLTIFDITGVHNIVVRYCYCPRSPIIDGGYRRRQLLRSMLFPATLMLPKTAFTFRILDHFHQLQSHSKITLHGFHNTIARLGNDAGLSPEVYRYDEISLVYRMWVDLKEEASKRTKGALNSKRDESSRLADRVDA